MVFCIVFFVDAAEKSIKYLDKIGPSAVPEQTLLMLERNQLNILTKLVPLQSQSKLYSPHKSNDIKSDL